jgi:hypothetical protein
MAIGRLLKRLFAKLRNEPPDNPESTTDPDAPPDWALDWFDEPQAIGFSNAVYYLGCEGDAPVTAIVRKNFKVLSDFFLKFRYEFIFYPDLESRKLAEAEKLLPGLTYNLPHWQGHEPDVLEIFSLSNAQHFYDSIVKSYGLLNIVTPAFFVKLSDVENTNFPISLEQSIPDQINKMLRALETLHHSNEQLIASKNSFSYYDSSFETQSGEEYDADESFGRETVISLEMTRQIGQLFKAGKNGTLLKIFTTLLEESKVHQPRLHRTFKEIASQDANQPKLSRLVVDGHYKIRLPDYDNMEIQMTPLPKTLYLLFLLHHEGINFHDLVDHKKELLYIYGQVTNSSSTREIRKRIDELTDMTKNSVNDKCSRIKEAFVSRMDNMVARNYYISGFRKERKKILLNHNMVIFEKE